jgi:uncharacterized protein YyaL (SSP411 family)
LEKAIQRLREGRKAREAPFIDKSIYAGWNGMAISAFLIAADRLDLTSVREFALKSLDRVISSCLVGDGKVRHSASMDEPAGLLEDGVFVARACLDAYNSVGDETYLSHAETIARDLSSRLWDEAQGGFFDLSPSAGLGGLLVQSRKPIQDAPTPSANGIAAEVFVRLHEITGSSQYRDTAEATLRAFARMAPQLGIFGGAYYLALDRFLRGSTHAIVSGPPNDPTARALWKSAIGSLRPYLTIRRIDPTQTVHGSLPIELQAMYRVEETRGYFCYRNACAQPAKSPDEFSSVLEKFGR